MSLINEALKKAQRARTAGAAAAAGDVEDQVVKRAQPKSAKSTLLIAVGAAALIVVSMVATALWMSRTPSTETKSAAATKPGASIAETPSPVLIVPPLASAPAAGTNSTVATTEAPLPIKPSSHATAAAPSAAPRPVPRPSTAAANLPPAPVLTAPPAVEPPPAPKQDERVHQFVEAIHVTGIRASGNESKVLMNDRVYRVNDIVDRELGVRLTKVSSDSLTFTDANGATYVKYF